MANHVGQYGDAGDPFGVVWDCDPDCPACEEGDVYDPAGDPMVGGPHDLVRRVEGDES